MEESPLSNLLKARQQAAADHVVVLEGVIETWESEYAAIKQKLRLKEDELQRCIVQATGIQAQFETETRLRTKLQKRLTESSRHVDALLELAGEKDQWREREASMVKKIEVLESKIRALKNKVWNFEPERNELNDQSNIFGRQAPDRSDPSTSISFAKASPSSPSSNALLPNAASPRYVSLWESYCSLQTQHEQLQEKYRSRKKEWTNFAKTYIQDLTEFRAAKRSRDRRHLEKKEGADAKGRGREIAMAQANNAEPLDRLIIGETTGRNSLLSKPSNATNTSSSLKVASPPFSMLHHSPLPSTSSAAVAQNAVPTTLVKREPSDKFPSLPRKLLLPNMSSNSPTGPSSITKNHVSPSNFFPRAQDLMSDLHSIEDINQRPDVITTSSRESGFTPTTLVGTSEKTDPSSSASATKWLGKPTLQPVLHEQNARSSGLIGSGKGAFQVKRSSSFTEQMVPVATLPDRTGDSGKQNQKRRSSVQLERKELKVTIKRELDANSLSEVCLQSPEVDVPNPHISRTVDSSSELGEKVSTRTRSELVEETPRSPSGFRQPDDLGSDQVVTLKKSRPIDPTAGMTPEEKKIFLKSLRNKNPKEVTALFSGFKGKGRYAIPESSVTPSKTINEEFQINKDNNQGVDYAFNRVVRKRDERKKLHATDCECCSGYYEAVGALPPGPQGPRWRSPAPMTNPEELEECSDSTRPIRREENPEERAERLKRDSVQMRKQQNSRHRADWEEPPTPPGYWNIGFPSSPEIAAQNQEAERMAQAKRARIEEEALRADGRYQRR